MGSDGCLSNAMPDSVRYRYGSVLDVAEMGPPGGCFRDRVSVDGAYGAAGVVSLTDLKFRHEGEKGVSIASSFSCFRLVANGVPILLLPMSEATSFLPFGGVNL